jgi:hypothetical protein
METLLAVFMNVIILMISGSPDLAQNESKLGRNWLAILDVRTK